MQANIIYIQVNYVAAHSQVRTASHLYSFVSEAIKLDFKNIRYRFYLNRPHLQFLIACRGVEGLERGYLAILAIIAVDFTFLNFPLPQY